MEYYALYMERAKAWPVESETMLIETPSGKTFARISGRSTDPPLILLPGSRGTSLTWIPNIAALSAHYRTYALDSIYDFGLSASQRKIKKPEDLVIWLDEVLTVLVPEGLFSLVGLSYGGWVVTQYVLRFPERIHKVVLLSPAGTVLPVSVTLICRALLTLIPFMGLRRQFYYWLLHDSVQGGETGRAFVDEAVADWIVAELCFARLPLVNATVLDDKELQRWKVPCVFLAGKNEKMYSARKAVRRLNRLAPCIKTEVIPQAGHDLWIVRADIVNGAMLSFLGEAMDHK